LSQVVCRRGLPLKERRPLWMFRQSAAANWSPWGGLVRVPAVHLPQQASQHGNPMPPGAYRGFALLWLHHDGQFDDSAVQAARHGRPARWNRRSRATRSTGPADWPCPGGGRCSPGNRPIACPPRFAARPDRPGWPALVRVDTCTWLRDGPSSPSEREASGRAPGRAPRD